MELKETVIGTENIYNGKILHLRVDTVRLPNGYELKREIVAHKGAVCVVPVLEDGTILMVRQFRLAAGQTLTGDTCRNAGSERRPRRLRRPRTGRGDRLSRLHAASALSNLSDPRLLYRAYLCLSRNGAYARPGTSRCRRERRTRRRADCRGGADGAVRRDRDAKTLCSLLVALRSL